MSNRILIALSFAILCVSVPLTLRLQPKVVERTLERNIIVDSSVKGELEQKINQWVKDDLERQIEKLAPQMQAYYRQKVDESWKKKDREFRMYFKSLRENSAAIVEKYIDEQERR